MGNFIFDALSYNKVSTGSSAKPAKEAIIIKTFSANDSEVNKRINTLRQKGYNIQILDKPNKDDFYNAELNIKDKGGKKSEYSLNYFGDFGRNNMNGKMFCKTNSTSKEDSNNIYCSDVNNIEEQMLKKYDNLSYNINNKVFTNKQQNNNG